MKLVNNGVRILNYLNVSTQNLDGDSGFRVQYEFMKACYEAGKDYFFYLIAPVEAQNLIDLPNVKVLPYKFRGYHYDSRFQFNISDFDKIIDQTQMDFDILWNNQPELTPQLLSFLRYVSHFDIPAVGYMHWLDVPESRNIGSMGEFEQTFIQQLAGILSSEFIGVNSWYAYRLWEKHFVTLFPLFDIRQLELHPLTLGVDLEEKNLFKDEKKFDKFTILFNHRSMGYTGYNELIKILKDIDLGNDIQILFTNPGKTQIGCLPEIKNVKFLGNLTREEYLKLIWKVDMGIAFHQEYSAWSLACVDLMAIGKPCLVPRKFAFPEIFGDYSLTFDNNKNFSEKLKYILDNRDEVRKWGNYCLERAKTKFDWRVVLPSWIDAIEKGLNFVKLDKTRTENSETLKKIIDIIEKNKFLRKCDLPEELNIGSRHPQIKWSPYRRGLQKVVLEDIENPDVVFYSGKADPAILPKMKYTKKTLTLEDI